MAALDAEVVDLLRQIQNRIAFNAQIEKCIEPLAAGIEVDHSAFEFTFADSRIPGTHPSALKAGPEHNVVFIEAANMRGRKIRAAPVQVVERAPSLAVAVFGFFLLDIVLLQGSAPTPAGIDQSSLVMEARWRGAGDDDGLQLLRT